MNVTTAATKRTTVNPVFKGTQRRFPPKLVKYIETLLRLSRVLLDL